MNSRWSVQLRNSHLVTCSKARPRRYCQGTPTMSTVFCYYQTTGSQAAAKTKAFEYGPPIIALPATHTDYCNRETCYSTNFIKLSFLDSSNEIIKIKQLGFDLKATWRSSKNSFCGDYMSPTDIHIAFGDGICTCKIHLANRGGVVAISITWSDGDVWRNENY